LRTGSADPVRYPQAQRVRKDSSRVQGAAAARPAPGELLHRVNQAGFGFSEQPVRPAQPVLMR